MVVGSQSFAAEQIMVCKAGNGKPRYYKLVTPFFGKAKVEQKVDGNWLDWCDDEYDTLNIYETAARCNYKKTITSTQDRPEYGIEKGMQLSREHSLLIDFEFFTRILDESLFVNKGNGFVEITNWHLRRISKTFTCEKND
ncbi:hypothetical protein N9F03_04715 [Planktomarina temperata]|nr:hypothetical protein [Planktomarina temperata]